MLRFPYMTQRASRKKRKGRPLTDSPVYAPFIHERDIALENILGKYLNALSLIVKTLSERVQEIASHMHVRGMPEMQLKKNRYEFEHRVGPWFDLASHQCEWLAYRLRSSAYAMSKAGEAEAIGRCINMRVNCDISGKAIEEMLSKDMPSGGNVTQRIGLGIERLKRDVIDAFQHSQVLDETPQETLARLAKAFPKPIKVKRPKKVLKKLHEAATHQKPNATFTFGFRDEDSWEDAVDDYLSDYLPDGIDRSPAGKLFFSGADTDSEAETVTRYQWEVENELTQDFVYSVRAGENEAANENGITDMQWLAILDDKTDECCSWRDGLSSQEIASQLEDEHSDDDCDAVVAPAHFNCRCRMVPISDELADVKKTDFSDFDSWLDQKAQNNNE